MKWSDCKSKRATGIVQLLLCSSREKLLIVRIPVGNAQTRHSLRPGTVADWIRSQSIRLTCSQQRPARCHLLHLFLANYEFVFRLALEWSPDWSPWIRRVNRTLRRWWSQLIRVVSNSCARAVPREFSRDYLSKLPPPLLSKRCSFVHDTSLLYQTAQPYW